MKYLYLKKLTVFFFVFLVISCKKNNLNDQNGMISNVSQKSINQTMSGSSVSLGLVSFAEGSVQIPLFGSGTASITVQGNGSTTTTSSVTVPGQFTFAYSNGTFYTVTAKALPNGNTDFVSFYAPESGGVVATCNVPYIYGQDINNTEDYTIVLNIDNQDISTYKVKYRIQYSNSNWNETEITTNNTKLVLTGLASGTSYDIQIAKVCGSSLSGYTETFVGSTIML
jgi:hypothetical protein